MTYVTGAAILAHANVSNPSAADTAWADTCALAVEALISHRMAGVTVDPGSDAERELVRAALQDGAAAYTDRKAPHGYLFSSDATGTTVRLGRDIARALEPVFTRYAGYGIA